MYQHTVYQLLTNSVSPLVLTPTTGTPTTPLSTHPLLTPTPIWGYLLGPLYPRSIILTRARARGGYSEVILRIRP
jgi:hypothetical protein